MNDIHTINNHLKGTIYRCDNPSTPNSPIMRGVITIDGVMLRIAVFPEKVSASGNVYNPIRLQYSPDSMHILQRKSITEAE